MPEVSAKRFLFQTIAWLIPAFALWYWLAPILVMPVGGLTSFALGWFYPHDILQVERQGYHLETVTRFGVDMLPQATVPPGADAQVVFGINALKYCYGLPLLVALTLATPTGVRHKLLCLGIGGMILTVFQSWGVYFETLLNLVFRLGPRIGRAVIDAQWQADAIALSYQLGYLILPPVLPVIIWAAFHTGFIRQLAPNLAPRNTQ